MKSNIFRVFAVFVTVVSVCMMGAALATFFVSPDVAAEMNTPAMQNYSFTRTTAEVPQWQVTRRFGDGSAVGSYATPYEALIKAHQDLKTQKDSQAAPLKAEKEQLDALVQRFVAAQAQDEAAVLARANVLQQIQAAEAAQLEQLSVELQSLIDASIAIREETAARRTDVLRLRHELEEVRTDLFRLNTVRRDLTDRLVRLEIENQALRDRQAQIAGLPASYDDEGEK